MKLSCLGLVAVFVSGCVADPQNPGLPQISLVHLQPISLEVAKIKIENIYVPPAARPNAEHKLPVSLAALTMSWAADRLKAAGSLG